MGNVVKAKSNFFIGVTGAKFSNIQTPGRNIGGILKIITDKSSISRKIDEYERQLGSVEHTFLSNQISGLIYSDETLSIDADNAGEIINGLLIDRLLQIQNWLMNLWLIKDNAIETDLGWMVVKFDSETTSNNNRWSTSFSKADGNVSTTQFSNGEIEQARAIDSFPVLKNEIKPVSLDLSEREPEKATKLNSKSLRFQRFLYFINGARANRDVPIKIALLCSGLEAMVSSANTELTHQVAERIACLLHPAGDKRLDTFRRIKIVYGIRSKAVHGLAFKENDNKGLLESAIYIDQTCREVANIYLTDEDFRKAIESNSAFDEFWWSLIFKTRDFAN